MFKKMKKENNGESTQEIKEEKVMTEIKMLKKERRKEVIKLVGKVLVSNVAGGVTTYFTVGAVGTAINCGNESDSLATLIGKSALSNIAGGLLGYVVTDAANKALNVEETIDRIIKLNTTIMTMDTAKAAEESGLDFDKIQEMMEDILGNNKETEVEYTIE